MSIRMAFFLRSIVAVALAISPAFGANVPRSIVGAWRIVRVIPTSNVQAEADKTLIGKRFTYRDHEANLGGKVVVAPLYTMKRANAHDFDSGFRVDVRELGLPRQGVIMVELWIMRPSDPIGPVKLPPQCERVSAPGGILIVKSATALITFWDGVFYEMRAVRPQAESGHGKKTAFSQSRPRCGSEEPPTDPYRNKPLAASHTTT